MKRVNVYFLLIAVMCFEILNLNNCYGKYHIMLNNETYNFFKEKSKIFENHPDGMWKLGIINKEQNVTNTILYRLKGFINHNDRDQFDCCEICHYIIMLNDKQLIFSEEDKEIILQAIKILAIYFIRNNYSFNKDIDSYKILHDCDFSKFFILMEDLPKKTKPKFCIIQ